MKPGRYKWPLENKKRVDIATIKKLVPMSHLLGYKDSEPPRNFNANGWASIRCPFHDDRRPSAQWSERENRFRCFACGIQGDVVDVVSQTRGLTIKGAISWLKESLLQTKSSVQ